MPRSQAFIPSPVQQPPAIIPERIVQTTGSMLPASRASDPTPLNAALQARRHPFPAPST